MKTFHSLDNVDKAELLHELFPDEIPELLDFILQMSSTSGQEEGGGIQRNDLLPPQLWGELVARAQGTIVKYRKRLNTRSRFFADQLFDGYTACFTVPCTTTFASLQNNRKFAKTVELLFFH